MTKEQLMKKYGIWVGGLTISGKTSYCYGNDRSTGLCSTDLKALVKQIKIIKELKE